MKKRLATIYAIFCTVVLLTGLLLAFCFARAESTEALIACLCSIAVSFIFVPIVHELGHITLGNCMKMRLVYVKCFCFQVRVEKGKKRLRFASPFAAEQTQMIPTVGGNMKKRASRYVLGGLLFSGIFFALLLAASVLCICLGKPKYELIGALPYAGYLFFLNAVPLEYAGGKTDTLVYKGIKKGYDGEKCMLAAMEIHGQLSEGKSFGEIDEAYYFDLPQLCEEEPLFALLLDLRYRYYLDVADLERAADCLNRLAHAQEYLADAETEKIAAELTYMHALRGDLVRAEESGKLCRNFLTGDTVTAKRILLAYSIAVEKADAIEPLWEQATVALEEETILGVRKFEESLLKKLREGEN